MTGSRRARCAPFTGWACRSGSTGSSTSSTASGSPGRARPWSRTPIPPTPRFPDHGYIIRRVDLDQILLDHAREAGAEVWEELQGHRPAGGGRPRRRRRRRSVTGKSWRSARRSWSAPTAPHSPLGRAMGLLVNDPLYLGISIRQYFEGVDGHRRLPRGLPRGGDKPGQRVGVPGDARRRGQRRRRRDALPHPARQDKPPPLHGGSDQPTAPRCPQAARTRRPSPRSRGALLRVGPRRQQGRVPGDDTGRGRRQHDKPGERRRHNLRARDRRDGGRPHPGQPHERPRLSHDPDEDSFRPKLVERYEHYFRIGARSIKWGNRTSFMRPLLAVVSTAPRHGASTWSGPHVPEALGGVPA